MRFFGCFVCAIRMGCANNGMHLICSSIVTDFLRIFWQMAYTVKPMVPFYIELFYVTHSGYYLHLEINIKGIGFYV